MNIKHIFISCTDILVIYSGVSDDRSKWPIIDYFGQYLPRCASNKCGNHFGRTLADVARTSFAQKVSNLHAV